MKLIPLTQGKCSVVDDDDFVRLGHLNWYAKLDRNTGAFYAARSIDIGGRKTTAYLHREVMAPLPAGMDIDHKSHDTLDNRRKNLCICTHSQNMMNRRGANKNSTSGIRGVDWFGPDGRWRARVTVAGKQILVGYYTSIEEANRCCVAARKKYFENRRPNEPR